MHYFNIRINTKIILLDYEDGEVEAAVLAHYRGQGWNCLHSENWLWNAAFGLLLWDIIYDPALGVFHSPSYVIICSGFLKSLPQIEIRLVVAHPLSAAEEATIREAAIAGLGHPFEITFTYTEEIKREASGKYAEFRSEIAAADTPRSPG